MHFFRKKTFESIKDVGSKSGLSKNFTAFDLVMLGLGGIIGTGVFVLTGLVAAKYSGPAVMISYAIAGATCIFVALAYTELATMLPTAGSIYTYSYVAFGEVFAWIIGSMLIVEMVIASGAVAAGWSGYVQTIFKAAGFEIPHSLANIPSQGGIINLPAVCVVMFVSVVLFLGNKGSKNLNAILVCIKITAIFAFIASAVPHFNYSNWDNFMPFGFNGVVFGASVLFFAFTGFGILASAAEECKNPARDITIGIIGSLGIAIVLYVIVSGLVTGIVSFEQLNNPQPLAHALLLNHSHIGSAIVATGAICGMTTVIMMNIYGISRIYYVIARDGLLPSFMSKLHAKYDTPYIAIFLFAGLTAFLAAFFPLETLAKMSSMAALIDYFLIAIIVLLFRINLPNVKRPFVCPMLFVTGPIAIVAVAYLISTSIFDQNWNLLDTGYILIYWILAAFALYVLRMLCVNSCNKSA